MFKKCYIGIEAKGMGFDAHVTILYLGDIDKDRFQFTQRVMKSLGPVDTLVERFKFDMFGLKTIPVITLNHYIELLNYRDALKLRGITQVNGRMYNWNPHITLKNSSDLIVLPKLIPLSNVYLESDTDNYRWYLT